MKKKIILLFTILAFISLGLFKYEREDWKPIKNYKNSSFYSWMLAEPLLKYYNIYNLDQTTTKFYLDKKYNFKKKPNIYIGIFESLVVPYDGFSDKVTSRHFFSKKLWWHKAHCSTFAGESARSEFEILCGIPSLKLIQIEFNRLYYTNKKLISLPNILKRYGYYSIVINASVPWIFSSRHAYKKLGFDEQIWPKKNNKKLYLQDAPKHYIYDGHFINTFVKDAIEKNQSKQPYLLYFFGVYGHYPYARDKIKRPDILKLNNPEMHNISNQFYYREQVIMNFLNYIKKTDPDSIVIICGDHLPHVSGYDYTFNKFSSYYTIYGADFTIENLYEIPSKVLSNITTDPIVIPDNLTDQYRAFFK